MRNLFKSSSFRFIKRDMDGNIAKIWNMPGIDATAKVVCKPCNEGWMSNLENRHAKSALSDLIIGDKNLIISSEQAKAISRFAFKTAVVVDHMRRDEESFFSRTERHNFRHSLKIPKSVRVWCAGYLHMGSGNLLPFWYNDYFSDKERLKLYTCTYLVGHFVFQLVAAEATGIREFGPALTFENLSIPLWPNIPNGGIQWPPITDVLRSKADFEKYAGRWETINKVALVHG